MLFQVHSIPHSIDCILISFETLKMFTLQSLSARNALFLPPRSLLSRFFQTSVSMGKSTGRDEVGYPILKRLHTRNRLALQEGINREWLSHGNKFIPMITDIS